MTREEAIEYFKDMNECTYGNVEPIQMAIKALEQEQTGHWIKKDGYSDCSECGSHIVTEWDYCPKCGAKMVEPTCDTCEYNTAAFMPCNACEDKSEYKPQESEYKA